MYSRDFSLLLIVNQKWFNATFRIPCRLKHHHVAPIILHSMHCMPIERRIHFKVFLTVALYFIWTYWPLTYLCYMLLTHHRNRWANCTRSSDDPVTLYAAHTLIVLDSRPFSEVDPKQLGNSLPKSVRSVRCHWGRNQMVVFSMCLLGVACIVCFYDLSDFHRDSPLHYGFHCAHQFITSSILW